MATSGRTAWLAGLVLGVLAGVLVLVFPIPGMVLLVAAAALLLLRGPRRFGVGGLLIGWGTTWATLLLRARLSCEAFDAGPAQECVMPTVDGFLVVGVTVAIAGLVLSAAALRGRRAS